MNTQESSRTRTERVVFYHPNGKGTGAAARWEPKINRSGDDRANCFFLEMAAQKTVAGGGNAASFDWENKITVKLGFLDICHILAVLEGKAEHAGGKRDGLYHQNGQTNTLIGLKRNENGGYLLSLSRKCAGEQESRRVTIVLSEIEALGLQHVLQVGLFFLILPAGGGRGQGGSRERQVSHGEAD